MIFDLGGGTFDVTVLHTNQAGTFTVLSTKGDMHMGGEDFNALLIQLMITLMKEENPDDEEIINEVIKKPNNLRKIRNAVEVAKKELTNTMGTMMTFESGEVELNYMLSRAKFEDTCSSLIPPIMNVVK